MKHTLALFGILALTLFGMTMPSAIAFAQDAPANKKQPASQAQPKPLKNAHAHNDYYHRRPLHDALDLGFCSVEADVFLHKGKLLVGHFKFELSSKRSLKNLYLDPLRQRVKSNGGVYQDGPPFTLLIDIKSGGPATYDALQKLLAEYPKMLSTMDTTVPGGFQQKAVTVIVSGARPKKEIAASNPRRAGIDGRISDLKSKQPSHLIPLISDHWGNNFQWRGEGPMPEAERRRLREIVEQAHQADRRVRFWATPENPAIWKELLDAGVDLIGADDLEALSEYFKQRPK